MAARLVEVHRERPPFLSLASPLERTTCGQVFAYGMQDAKVIRERLEQMRGQFLQWGTPELQVFVVTKALYIVA